MLIVIWLLLQCCFFAVYPLEIYDSHPKFTILSYSSSTCMNSNKENESCLDIDIGTKSYLPTLPANLTTGRENCYSVKVLSYEEADVQEMTNVFFFIEKEEIRKDDDDDDFYQFYVTYFSANSCSQANVTLLGRTEILTETLCEKLNVEDSGSVENPTFFKIYRGCSRGRKTYLYFESFLLRDKELFIVPFILTAQVFAIIVCCFGCSVICLSGQNILASLYKKSSLLEENEEGENILKKFCFRIAGQIFVSLFTLAYVSFGTGWGFVILLGCSPLLIVIILILTCCYPCLPCCLCIGVNFNPCGCCFDVPLSSLWFFYAWYIQEKGSYNEKYKVLNEDFDELPEVIKSYFNPRHWCKILKRIHISLLLVISWAVRNSFEIFLMLVLAALLEEDQSNVKYIELQSWNLNIQITLLLIVVSFTVLNIFLMISNAHMHLISPFHTAILISTFKENIFFRCVQVFVYIMAINLLVFVNVDLNRIVQLKFDSFEDFMIAVGDMLMFVFHYDYFDWEFIFYFLKVIVPFLLMVKKIYSILVFNDVGSHINQMKVKFLPIFFALPEPSIGFVDAITESSESILSNLSFCLSLLDIKYEKKVLKKMKEKRDRKIMKEKLNKKEEEVISEEVEFMANLKGNVGDSSFLNRCCGSCFNKRKSRRDLIRDEKKKSEEMKRTIEKKIEKFEDSPNYDHLNWGLIKGRLDHELRFLSFYLGENDMRILFLEILRFHKKNEKWAQKVVRNKLTEKPEEKKRYQYFTIFVEGYKQVLDPSFWINEIKFLQTLLYESPLSREFFANCCCCLCMICVCNTNEDEDEDEDDDEEKKKDLESERGDNMDEDSELKKEELEEDKQGEVEEGEEEEEKSGGELENEKSVEATGVNEIEKDERSVEKEGKEKDKEREDDNSKVEKEKGSNSDDSSDLDIELDDIRIDKVLDGKTDGENNDEEKKEEESDRENDNDEKIKEDDGRKEDEKEGNGGDENDQNERKGENEKNSHKEDEKEDYEKSEDENESDGD